MNKKIERLQIIPYTSQLKREWDNFIDGSKNGTFILKRDYMDYHADRFEDSSFLIYYKNSLYTVFPACRVGDIIFSHAGLTYGGFIMTHRCTVEGMLECSDELFDFLYVRGIRKIIYKPVPHIYHKVPAEEDLYVLFRHNAILSARNVATVVYQDHRLKFRNIRKHGIRLAQSAGVRIMESQDYYEFWKILSTNLKNKYDSVPVHSLEEMIKLAHNFPDNIKLYVATIDNSMVAGVVCYITSQTVHVQYISASAKGKETGALDLLFDFLLNEKFLSINYFDFGTSNEKGGKILNENLIYQKEGFGGRAICYDTYEIFLNHE